MDTETHLFAGVAGYVGRQEDVGAVGVFRCFPNTGKWDHVLADLETYAVLVHPERAGVVFAGTQDGVWRSTDNGSTFKRSDFPDAKRQVWSFLIDSRDANRIYAGGSPIDVYRSDDCGATWTKLPSPGIKEHCKAAFDARVMRMVQHPTRADEIYAALEVNGVMRTEDGGQTWTDLSHDLIRLSEHEHLKSKIVSDTFAEGMLDSHAITISPSQPNDVILAVRMGLFRSGDKGETWQDMDIGRFSPTTYGRDVKASPQDPSTLYAALSVAAASHDGGVYRSLDAGKTWSRFDKVQVHGTIMSVCLHPRDADQVYIGARYQGEIFGTSDGGNSWAVLPLPSPVKDIYSLACG
ncbi:MAG: WD40/YVTN/BNR-like repeat-containing protein [Hyphomicrobiaceae bacterium]